MQFKKATREQAKLRAALVGPSGSGKTYTALNIATHLGGRVAVIDTEHGSASLYAGGKPFDFDVLELTSFHPDRYTEAIIAAEKAGYDVLVIDSLSHAWQGKDGALETVDRAKNSFTEGWRNVTPSHNRMVDTIIGARLHVIATMRVKTEYVVEEDEKTGKKVPRKIGLAPVQRAGMEYEFGVVADLDLDHNLTVSKTRCLALDGVTVNKPGPALAATLLEWLSEGDEVEYATDTQVDRIAELVAAAADNDASKAEALVAKVKGEYGVDAIGRLRAAQADEAIGRLESVIEKQLNRQVDEAATALQAELGADEVAA